MNSNGNGNGNGNSIGNSNIPEERNQESTVFVGELAPDVTEDLLWELMLQAGPVLSVHIPKDRATNAHSGFGFAEFAAPKDADYAVRVMNGVPLFGRPIRVSKSRFGKNGLGNGSGSGGGLSVGANLFVGNLDPAVDEKMLLDTFSAFGEIIANPKVARDTDNRSKGYGFVNFASFDSSDAAIEAMNGQFFCNRPITVAYAFKNDGSGERHGTQAERQLALKLRGSRPQALTPAAAAAATAATLASILPADIPSAALSSVYGVAQQQKQQQFQGMHQQMPGFPLLPTQMQQQQQSQLPQPAPVPIPAPPGSSTSLLQPMYPPGFIPY